MATLIKAVTTGVRVIEWFIKFPFLQRCVQLFVTASPNFTAPIDLRNRPITPA
jgi:hypothetical protein